ncbi:hypothetical protein [Streptomyces lanatus]|uniref:ATP-binding protein n=1 Tax=Streptomyces lanatus TaxID=66900 RepID=A0ABV1XI58_9ACTN|nr:hypothetical protein [Streptomyces lanatus]GHG93900.1 hypothetical protein GCM10018780_16760 [Streptomyces lanatus]
MKKAVFTTAALAIGAGLVGGSAAAASAAGGGSGISPIGGLMSPTKVSPAVVPAADVVSNLARDGGIAKGSAFDKKGPGQQMSGIYLDGMDPEAVRKPTIPVKNPAGSGNVQVRPLKAPTAAGLGTLLPNK